MYNLSKTFKKFCDEKVSLDGATKQKLREKKNINLDRLKDGLNDYNRKYYTNYKIVNIIEQGSVAMSTVTQNENNDFDIDVAIIFDEDSIRDITPRAIKNVVAEALKNRCKSFKTPPEPLTNCVRIVYSDNYHIDFAIYKRIKQRDGSYKYEHAGSEWRPRDPRAINKWFYNKKKDNGDCLNKVIKLSKMFCKSRKEWTMPGGLIQTILVSEQISKYKNEDRLDKLFYYTMVAIRDRLEYDTEVINPTDSTQSILLKKHHEDTMNVFKNRLTTHLNKLAVLFEKDCTLKKAMNAWHEFFNNDFWNDSIINECGILMNFNRNTYEMYSELTNTKSNVDEEFIENLYDIDLRYEMTIDCLVSHKGLPKGYLRYMPSNTVDIEDDLEVRVKNCNIVRDFEVLVKIYGGELEGRILSIFDSNIRPLKFKQRGTYFIECYAIRNGVCIAKDWIRIFIK